MVGYKTVKKEIAVKNNQKQHFILEENAISLNAVDVLGKSRTQPLTHNG
jgi:hypothetical protein